MVYVNQRALVQQLDTLLPLYKKWGLKATNDCVRITIEPLDRYVSFDWNPTDLPLWRLYALER